jgi:hypothetical protein
MTLRRKTFHVGRAVKEKAGGSQGRTHGCAPTTGMDGSCRELHCEAAPPRNLQRGFLSLIRTKQFQSADSVAAPLRGVRVGSLPTECSGEFQPSPNNTTNRSLDWFPFRRRCLVDTDFPGEVLMRCFYGWLILLLVCEADAAEFRDPRGVSASSYLERGNDWYRTVPRILSASVWISPDGFLADASW